MNNEEILNLKEKFGVHFTRVQELIMEKEGIPRHNVERALKWLEDHSVEAREIAEEIYSSEDKDDAELRDQIISDNEENWKIAAEKIEKLFKVHV